jgi:drug/metabolite transporter (DMT)-like permease
VGNFFGLLAGCGWGYSDYYGGHASQKMDRLLLFGYTQLFSFLPFLLLTLIIPSELSAAALLWGTFAGFGNLVGMLTFFEALSLERMSIVTPISGVFNALIPVMYALLVKNESLSTSVATGIVFALIGVAIVSASTDVAYAPATRSSSAHHLKGVVLAVGCGVVFGLIYVSIAAAPEASGMWPLVASRFVVPIAFGAAYLRRRSISISRSQAKTTVIWMLFGSSAFVFFRLGVHYGNIAVVSVLATASPVFTAILAWVIDGEHKTRRQIYGVVLAGVGIALLNT